jgi:hypothetical protein
MNLDLSDEEAKALAAELDGIVRNDRYPLSPRIQLLKAILGKLRPEPVREPLPGTGCHAFRDLARSGGLFADNRTPGATPALRPKP